MQITYETVGEVQTTFLRLLSERARQNFTYTCINSAAWLPEKDKKGLSDNALRLLGDDEHVFLANDTGPDRPSVLHDGCKVNNYVT